jgi:hypothetical protein
MGLFGNRKKSGKLHFALVMADAPLDDAKFTIDKDCKYFVASGEVEPHDVIPRTVLREIVDRFARHSPVGGEVKIAERNS